MRTNTKFDGDTDANPYRIKIISYNDGQRWFKRTIEKLVLSLLTDVVVHKKKSTNKQISAFSFITRLPTCFQGCVSLATTMKPLTRVSGSASWCGKCRDKLIHSDALSTRESQKKTDHPTQNSQSPVHQWSCDTYELGGLILSLLVKKRDR